MALQTFSALAEPIRVHTLACRRMTSTGYRNQLRRLPDYVAHFDTGIRATSKLALRVGIPINEFPLSLTLGHHSDDVPSN